MKKYDYIAWDFNGTILDDVQIGIESINVLLSRRGLKTIDSKEEYQKGFRFPIIEWYRDLGFDFEKEDYAVTANEWVAEYLSREKLAPMCEGVRDLLETARKVGSRQIVISASEITMLKRQLSKLGVDEYFDEIVGKSDVFAGSKVETAKRWREMNPGKVLFIGDTDHDLETAEAIGADCVLVAAGHQSYDRLSELIGDSGVDLCVVEKLSEVKGILLNDRVE